MLSRLKTGRRLSRLPDTRRSFSKPLYHKVLLPSFVPVQCLLQLLIFVPVGRSLLIWLSIFLRNILHPERIPSQVKQSLLVLVLQKTHMILWKQGALYSLQYRVFRLGIQAAILKTHIVLGSGAGVGQVYVKVSQSSLTMFQQSFSCLNVHLVAVNCCLSSRVAIKLILAVFDRFFQEFMGRDKTLTFLLCHLH